MKKMFSEFKEFVMRGNVLDLAVAVIIGGAFQAIVSSLCDDVITPVIQLIISKCIGVDSIDEMTKVLNVGTIQFGSFISAILNFLIMALIIFLIVKAINKVMNVKKKEEQPAEPTTKVCPFCQSEISIKAVKCPHCTSDQPEPEEEEEK
ncbi:MAG: large conductance mechanosensitive channel protein MscL [Oscillospiraceae bacterium]|nr:large conductance mechanosensitive channel protein MscL [Oscillospiraceae bacterium]